MLVKFLGESTPYKVPKALIPFQKAHLDVSFLLKVKALMFSYLKKEAVRYVLKNLRGTWHMRTWRRLAFTVHREQHTHLTGLGHFQAQRGGEGRYGLWSRTERTGKAQVCSFLADRPWPQSVSVCSTVKWAYFAGSPQEWRGRASGTGLAHRKPWVHCSCSYPHLRHHRFHDMLEGYLNLRQTNGEVFKERKQ